MSKSERKLVIHIRCKHCGLKANIKVRYSDYCDWSLGKALFDEAFPYLKAWEKRMLLTEECKDCYNEKLYGNTLFKVVNI